MVIKSYSRFARIWSLYCTNIYAQFSRMEEIYLTLSKAIFQTSNVTEHCWKTQRTSSSAFSHSTQREGPWIFIFLRFSDADIFPWTNSQHNRLILGNLSLFQFLPSIMSTGICGNFSSRNSYLALTKYMFFLWPIYMHCSSREVIIRVKPFNTLTIDNQWFWRLGGACGWVRDVRTMSANPLAIIIPTQCVIDLDGTLCVHPISQINYSFILTH